jgi:elongation factor Ts
MTQISLVVVAVAFAYAQAFGVPHGIRVARTSSTTALQATITAAMVSQLRQKTDAPMMECKKALNESEGDMARAEEIIRVKLGTKASKVGSRIAAEGLVIAIIEGSKGVLMEANCETDFVSKNPDFIAFTNACAKKILVENPADIASLLTADMDGQSVEKTRSDLVGKIGENMSLRRFKRFEGTSKLASYIHGKSIGVIVEYDGDEQAAKDVCMHIACNKPLSLDASGVPAEKIEAERNIAALKAAESGKSAEIAAKMVEGSVAKYLKEVSLLSQPFVKNDKITVQQMLKDTKTTVKGYSIFVVGEGMEKKEDTFVEEIKKANEKVAAARAAAEA